MLVVTAYDIDTTTKFGQKRLNKIAKICENYGQRVQDSLFEMYIDWDTYLIMETELEKNLDTKFDSIRIYILGNKYENKVVYLGQNNLINVDKCPIIF
jgi:CRISPR-associated protein Cas2